MEDGFGREVMDIGRDQLETEINIENWDLGFWLHLKIQEYSGFLAKDRSNKNKK